MGACKVYGIPHYKPHPRWVGLFVPFERRGRIPCDPKTKNEEEKSNERKNTKPWNNINNINNHSNNTANTSRSGNRYDRTSGGLIDKAKESKEKAQIDEEREIVGTSAVQSAEANRYGNIEKSELEIYVDKNAGNRQTEVIDNGETVVVKFVDSGRYYEIDTDGAVSNPIEIGKDENAGDITKGGTCDGSEDKPFEINCIEDLVVFSIMSNGGNSELGITSSDFENQYVILKRTLDFNSIFSYNDYTTRKYGDLNKDGAIEDIKTELTKTTEGCIGYTPVGQKMKFVGNFDGKRNYIKNIYICSNKQAGLFAIIGKNAKIENLGLTGNIETNNATGETVFATAGGIVGAVFNGNVIISNCINRTNVKADYYVGGIIGLIHGTANCKIYNCFNTGNITGNVSGSNGGILGCAYTPSNGQTQNTYIYNCYNIGRVYSEKLAVGGIVGAISGWNSSVLNTYICNCYNSGNVTTSSFETGGIFASTLGASLILKNVFMLEEPQYNVGFSKSRHYQWNFIWVVSCY